MFNKWFNQDINNFLSKRNRVVVVDESTHLDLLQKVLPTEYKVFGLAGAFEQKLTHWVNKINKFIKKQ